MNRFHTLSSAALVIALLACAPLASAGDRAQPALVADSNTYDSATHLHTYSYVLSNPSSNTAPLETFVIKLQPGVDVVTDFKAPPGWRVFYSAEQGTVMWAAVGYLDPEASDPSGDIPPSDFALQPGTSLAGFSLKSFGPPGTGLAITQSYAPLFAATDDVDVEAAENDQSISTLPEDNGYRLTTILPVPDADWTGNRRPAVDGFLVFANLKDKSTYAGSVLVVLRLGSAGEEVDATTLNVTLNSVDVTNLLVWSDQYQGYAAVFAPHSSPVRIGTNTLRTSVQGIVPGTLDKIATDTDRLTFEFLLQ